MENKFYIAYGSNMSVSQMKHRCPDAKVLGIATLNNYKLVFRTHATIEPSPGDCVPVVLWEISPNDESRLDIYEGYPSYYKKQEMYVSARSLDGTKEYSVNATVYVMNDGHDIAIPAAFYHKSILDSYIHFGLDLTPIYKAMREASGF